MEIKIKKAGFVALSIIIFIIALFSCNKDEDDTTTGVYLPMKVSGTQNGDQWVVTFKYDLQNRLVRAISGYNGVTQYVMDVVYQLPNRYEINFFNEGDNTPYTTYFAEESDDAIEVTVIGYDADGEEYSAYEYGYDMENGRIAGCYFDYGMETYFYDAAGNMIRREWADILSPDTYTATYEYDDWKGIFSNIKTPAWILWDVLDIEWLDEPWFFVNNVTRCKIGDFEGRYEYACNAAGYPTAVRINDNYNGVEYKTDVKIEY
jgi:hypothetical protein